MRAALRAGLPLIAISAGALGFDHSVGCLERSPLVNGGNWVQTSYAFCRLGFKPFYQTRQGLSELASAAFEEQDYARASAAFHQLACGAGPRLGAVQKNIAILLDRLDAKRALHARVTLLTTGAGSKISLSVQGMDDWRRVAELALNEAAALAPALHRIERLLRQATRRTRSGRRVPPDVRDRLPLLEAYRGALVARTGRVRAAARIFGSAAESTVPGRISDRIMYALRTAVLQIALRYQASPFATPVCPRKGLQAVERGHRENRRSLAVVGATKGGGREQILRMRERIVRLGELEFGGNYQVFILENDSPDDGTKEALVEWARADPCRVHVRCVDIGGTSQGAFGSYGMRPKVIAEVRNQYLDMARAHPFWPFTYVLALDLDLAPFDVSAVQNAVFNNNGKQGGTVASTMASTIGEGAWDAVCANGVISEQNNRFYDTYAYRTKDYPWGPNDDASTIPYGSYWGEYGDRPYMFELQLKATRKPGDAPVPVLSCFSGLAVYKGGLFNSCAYDAVFDSEHILMHKCMREKHKMRMYMLPDLMVTYRLEQEDLDHWKQCERQYWARKGKHSRLS